jgi:hypothetical protein
MIIRKDVLGLWIEQTEGAKFWLKIVNDLKARGGQSNATARIGGASAPISLSGETHQREAVATAQIAASSPAEPRRGLKPGGQVC